MKSRLEWLGYCAVVLSLVAGTIGFGVLGAAPPVPLLVGLIRRRRWLQIVGASLLSVTVLIPFAIGVYESWHNFFPYHDVVFVGIAAIWFLAATAVASYAFALTKSFQHDPTLKLIE